MVRYRIASGEPVVRCLEPFEYMRFQGWDDRQWRRVSDVDGGIDFYELCANLAGNSYSIFHFGPWAIATLSTWGRFVCSGNRENRVEVRRPATRQLQRNDTDMSFLSASSY